MFLTHSESITWHWVYVLSYKAVEGDFERWYIYVGSQCLEQPRNFQFEPIVKGWYGNCQIPLIYTYKSIAKENIRENMSGKGVLMGGKRPTHYDKFHRFWPFSFWTFSFSKVRPRLLTKYQNRYFSKLFIFSEEGY